ncbi:hypothetical protein BKA69DRAFT_107501 [Paraphysoderma sedebokerense]|nr:hypothetical protein BKA69DRAFT_107501 [Paraphysoderma sedebokerense]
MKRTSVSLLFALAALQNGALAVPAPQFAGLPALPNINPPTEIPSLPTEALSSIVGQISTLSENVGALPTENLPVPPISDILNELSTFTEIIPTESLPTESLVSMLTDEIAFYTEVLPYVPEEERNSLIDEIIPTEDVMSFLSELSSLTSQLGSMPTDYSDPYTEDEFMTDTEELPATSVVELPETSTVESPATSLVNTDSSVISTATPTSTQEESPKATSSFVPKVPVPTSISNNPLETQFNKFANFQKTLNTSLNEQGTKLTVQVSSSSSGQSFRGDFNLQ